jgi:hypothetical protein
MNIFRSFFCTALLLWPLTNLALDTNEIKFKKGQHASVVHGQVTSSSVTYQFKAQKGQSITVGLLPKGGDKGNLTFSLYSYCGEEFGTPLVGDSIHWQGTIPCSDKYTIDVTPSTEAMQQKRKQAYSLTIRLKSD